MSSTNMLAKLKVHLQKNDLILDEDKLLIAVSGGVDSMALVTMLSELEFKFSVAHVNFGLRGGDSDLDEQLVVDWCDQQNVECHVYRPDTQAYANNHGMSIQMAARDIRYDWFEELMTTYEYTHVVTAHHANDSLETAIYNLTKGTGIHGVRGILARTNQRIRPLLIFTKDEILEYASCKDVPWIEDASNSESKYSRNKIRNEVIPKLEEINPSIVEGYVSSQRRLAGAEVILANYVESIRAKHCSVDSDGSLAIDLSWMKQDDASVTVLNELLQDYGFSFDQCEQIQISTSTGAMFESRSHILNLDRNRLIVQKQAEDLVDQALFENQTEFEMEGKYDLEILSMVEDLTIDRASSNVMLDYEKLTFPLKLRRWRLGDRFVPLGMTTRKKVSDFLIDEKIPRILKGRVMVLESDGQICWVLGHRVDQRFAISQNTKRIYHIIKK